VRGAEAGSGVALAIAGQPRVVLTRPLAALFAEPDVLIDNA
jgi:hypothetical protein